MEIFLSWLSAHFEGVITLLTGGFVFVMYRRTRADTKKDAAALILQEIRYADQKIRNYRTYNSYNFMETLLPTNSWNRNINLFIRELNESELDLISKFFSSASYLDEVIKAISNYHNSYWTQTNTPAISDSSTPIAVATGSLIDDRAKRLIEAISKDIESIYNTPAADKLRKISSRSRFKLW